MCGFEFRPNVFVQKCHKKAEPETILLSPSPASHWTRFFNCNGVLPTTHQNRTSCFWLAPAENRRHSPRCNPNASAKATDRELASSQRQPASVQHISGGCSTASPANMFPAFHLA